VSLLYPLGARHEHTISAPENCYADVPPGKARRTSSGAGRRLYPALGEPAAFTLGVEAPGYDVAVDELGMLARRAVDAREVRPDGGHGLHLANVGRLGDGRHRPNVSLRSPHGAFCPSSSPRPLGRIEYPHVLRIRPRPRRASSSSAPIRARRPRASAGRCRNPARCRIRSRARRRATARPRPPPQRSRGRGCGRG
jgi:hypothetical protein